MVPFVPWEESPKRSVWYRVSKPIVTLANWDGISDFLITLRVCESTSECHIINIEGLVGDV